MCLLFLPLSSDESLARSTADFRATDSLLPAYIQKYPPAHVSNAYVYALYTICICSIPYILYNITIYIVYEVSVYKI